jgi:hypothetical protein
MMDHVGHLLYVVEMVWMCVLAIATLRMDRMQKRIPWSSLPLHAHGRMYRKGAPAGGATAAALERGAFAGPSALTLTSSWWALVTM